MLRRISLKIHQMNRGSFFVYILPKPPTTIIKDKTRKSEIFFSHLVVGPSHDTSYNPHGTTQ